jgi:hypothetical protein
MFAATKISTVDKVDRGIFCGFFLEADFSRSVLWPRLPKPVVSNLASKTLLSHMRTSCAFLDALKCFAGQSSHIGENVG